MSEFGQVLRKCTPTAYGWARKWLLGRSLNVLDPLLDNLDQNFTHYVTSLHRLPLNKEHDNFYGTSHSHQFGYDIQQHSKFLTKSFFQCEFKSSNWHSTILRQIEGIFILPQGCLVSLSIIGFRVYELA